MLLWTLAYRIAAEAIEDFAEYCQGALLLKGQRRLFSVFELTGKRQSTLRKLRVLTLPSSPSGPNLRPGSVQREVRINEGCPLAIDLLLLQGL